LKQGGCLSSWPSPHTTAWVIPESFKGEFGMRAKSRYSLQRTMIIYFLLIGFASMLVGIEFLAEFQGGALKAELWAGIQQAGQSPMDPDLLFAPIDRLRSKAILMVVIIIVVMIIVLTMFIKNITEPLQHMIQVSRKISAGDLSQTVRIDADNELSELGNVIDEMATNLQEVILLCQSMCDNGQGFIDDALAQIKNNAQIEPADNQLLKTIQRLGGELATLNDVIAHFSFYTVESSGDV
jgi:methyl-accepting chemotaxis protein